MEWAQRLAGSEMARRGDSLDFHEGAKAPWNYTSGFFAFSLEELGAASADTRFSDYGARIVDSCIGADGTIRGYDRSEYNLDLITPGRAVLELYEKNHEPRLKAAVDILRAQLGKQPRTSDGGFWHKLIYPNQMWLDGLYMAGPFYAAYSADFSDPAGTADAVKQLRLADAHLYDPKTGLYYHAWDATRTQDWADPKTGHSPNFWARSIGWYAMATADILDALPKGDPAVGPVTALFQRTAAGIVRWQDPASGVWWQVVDQGGRAGNYHEASASCMYVYALAKGVNRGWLAREPCALAALKGYSGLIRQFIRSDPDGKVSLMGCCSVAGLGNKNAAGRKRDGSFDYYVSEPVVANDLKGVSAFIMASLAVEQLAGQVP